MKKARYILTRSTKILSLCAWEISMVPKTRQHVPVAYVTSTIHYLSIPAVNVLSLFQDFLEGEEKRSEVPDVPSGPSDEWYDTPVREGVGAGAMLEGNSRFGVGPAVLYCKKVI